MHMAIGAVVNAVWDLAAKRADKPLWRAPRRGRPRVARRPDRLPLPHRRAHPRGGAGASCAGAGRAPRNAPRTSWRRGFPAYTTSAGLARLRRREAHPARRRGRRRRLPADQAEGRRRPRRRRTPLPCRPPGRRPRHPHGDRRQPALGRRRGDPLDQGARRVRPVLDRGAHQPRRHPRPRRDPQGRRPGQGRHRRARPEPDRLQAAPPGRRRRRPPDRRGPRRRRQREPRDPAARGQVRRAGLPARGRRRPVRTRPAPVDVRLRRPLRHHRGPGHRVRRPSARPLPRPGGDPRGPLHGTHRAGLLGRHAARVPRAVHASPTAPSGPPTSRRRHENKKGQAA